MRNPGVLYRCENLCQSLSTNILQQNEAVREVELLLLLGLRSFESLASEQIAELLVPCIRRKNLNTDTKRTKNFLRQ